MIFFLNINFLSIWSLTTRKKLCKTTNETNAAKQNVACHFPFILFGKVYEKCTTAKDPDGKFWCSTEVDESGQHVRKKWGYCSNKCDLSEIQTNTRYL